MGGQFGFDQIKKVVVFGLAFGEAAYAAAHEAGAMRRASAFLGCLDEAADLLTLDHDLLRKQWSEFDADDRAALFAECADEFDLDDDGLEAKVEAAMGAGLKLLEGVEAAVAIWKGGAAA